MKAVSALPAHYKESNAVDLLKTKKTALLVNALALLIGIAMAVPMHFIIPVTTLFDNPEDLLLRMLSLSGMLIAYMILHELVHGIAMKLCGTKKVKYGFTGLYAFAGSEDYYPKKPYIFIALAPVVLWGIVLAILNAFVPAHWFWIIYIVQIMNISGAAGDFFVTIKFLKFPADILIRDHGVGMLVYAEDATGNNDRT